MLKYKPGQLSSYILDFNMLGSCAGYILTGDWGNPVLSEMFLQGLNPRLQTKIEEQKELPETLSGIIDDARYFEKSFYRSQVKMKIMNWQPSHPVPCPSFTPKAPDPDPMDMNRLMIDE